MSKEAHSLQIFLLLKKRVEEIAPAFLAENKLSHSDLLQEMAGCRYSQERTSPQSLQ
jgi:hypothetical protein